MKPFLATLFFLVCVTPLLAGGLARSPQTIAAPVLKWQNGGCQDTWCRTGWYASPAVADLDGDGRPEVIWSDYRLVVVNGEDGSTVWTTPTPGGGRSWPSPVVADVDQSGTVEIVAAHADGWVSVTTATGTPLPGWPQQPTPGSELRSLAVSDMDADGTLEILVCATRSENQWVVLEHDGTLRPGWPVHSPDSDSNGYAAGCYNQNTGLSDLDGDGRTEMIGPNDTHYVVGYHDDGTPLRANGLYGQVDGQNKPWARVGFHYEHSVDLRGYARCGSADPLEPRPNFADSAPSFADVDGDGVREIVLVGNQYDCRATPYRSLFHSPYLLRADRTRWAGGGFDWTALPTPATDSAPLAEDYTIIETALPNPVVADLDGDGRSEILYASYDGKLHVYGLDRSEPGQWPFQISDASGPLRFGSEPVVADLDHDGKAEVLLTTWPQKGSNLGGQLLLLAADGTLLHAVALPRAATQDWDGALGAPTLTNIDADDELEVVVGTVHTGLVAYDLPGSAGARVLWGTSRGNYQRTGEAPPRPSEGSESLFLPFLRR